MSEQTICPDCDSDDLQFSDYDFGTSAETGYHDAGERFMCLDCGAGGDADAEFGEEVAS